MKKLGAVAAVLLATVLPAGCAGKKPETTSHPSSTPVKTAPSASDPAINAMEKELSEIDALIAMLEKEDTMDVPEILEFK